jgi:hypothetical protein
LALSGLAQKPASACDASSARRRSALAVRSKKVSEIGDAPLEVGEAVEEVGHAGLLIEDRGNLMAVCGKR